MTINMARAEAAAELCAMLLESTGDAFIKHGDDPENETILATALQMFVERVDKSIFPGFQAFVIKALTDPERE